MIILFTVSMIPVGCRTEKGPELTTTGGTILLDGKPVSGVMIQFIPKTGTPGNGGFGNTDESGQYTLRSPGGKTGVQPGQYTVIFSKFVMPDGSAVPEDVQPESVGAKQALPHRYTSLETSQAEASVDQSSKVFDFSLTTK